MDLDALLEAIRESLVAITESRFYENERGFQGQLLIQLSQRTPALIPNNHAILEQEHQKTLEHHGLDIRPDIILHKPFDPAIHQSRKDGNFAVIELKRRAGPKKAVEDFESLHSMLEILRYPIGIFINIGHTKTQVEHVPEKYRGRIIAFATKLTENGVRVDMARA
jgi:hypothetical protein